MNFLCEYSVSFASEFAMSLESGTICEIPWTYYRGMCILLKLNSTDAVDNYQLYDIGTLSSDLTYRLSTNNVYNFVFLLMLYLFCCNISGYFVG